MTNQFEKITPCHESCRCFKQRVDVAIRNGQQLLEDGQQRKKQNVVMWIDLLGFQRQWLNNTELALLRISVFHELSLQAVNPDHHIAQLNDATVLSMDFSDDDDPQKLTNFLVRCDSLLEISTAADKKIGGYGTRADISIENRYNLRGNFGGIAPDRNLTLDKIHFASPVPIMMNMAFARSQNRNM